MEREQIFYPLKKQDIILGLQEILGDGLLPAKHNRKIRDVINTLSVSKILIWHKAEDEAPLIGERVLVRPQGGFYQNLRGQF